jgi:hypothetical protein
MDLRMHSSLLQRIVSATLASWLFISAMVGQTPAPQQSAQDQQKLFKLRISSELVLVNVVARDKQGKPVTDLKRDDFTLLEDGKPQRVTSFDYENLDTMPIVAAGGPSQQTTADQPLAPVKPILSRKDAEDALSNKRVIVLFFDFS